MHFMKLLVLISCLIWLQKWLMGSLLAEQRDISCHQVWCYFHLFCWHSLKFDRNQSRRKVYFLLAVVSHEKFLSQLQKNECGQILAKETRDLTFKRSLWSVPCSFMKFINPFQRQKIENIDPEPPNIAA